MQCHAKKTTVDYVHPNISIPAVHLVMVSQQSNVLLSPYASSAMQWYYSAHIWTDVTHQTWWRTWCNSLTMVTTSCMICNSIMWSQTHINTQCWQMQWTVNIK